MRTAALVLLILCLPAVAFAQEVTQEDIIKLHQAGCGDELILTYLGAKGATLKLSADDIAALKAAGVSETVITAVLKGPVPPPRRETPPPRRVRPAPVIVSPPPTVIYERYDPWPYVTHDPYYYTPRHHFSFGYGGHFGHHGYSGHHGGHHGGHSSFSFGVHW